MQKPYSGTKQKYLIWYIVFNILKYDANEKLGYLYVKFTYLYMHLLVVFLIMNHQYMDMNHLNLKN